MKRRSLITFAILALIVFAGVAFYGDYRGVLGRISSFPIAYWIMALGLASANYLLRLLRWNYYLKLLGIRIGATDSAAIFLSGLSMAISPGRVGELTKSYFLKEKLDVPVARSSPIVVTERVTDLIAISLLSSWGLIFVPYGWAVALFLSASAVFFIVFLVSPWGIDKMLRLPFPQRWRPFLNTSRDTFKELLSFKPLAVALVLSILAWFAEGAALWLVLRGLDTTAPLGQSVSIYCAATLLGAITLLPGGLVGTEGGMIALLQRLDLTRTQASTATFIIRLCTLWFAVAIGLLAILYVQLYMTKKAVEDADPMTKHSNISGQTGRRKCTGE